MILELKDNNNSTHLENLNNEVHVEYERAFKKQKKIGCFQKYEKKHEIGNPVEVDDLNFYLKSKI